MSGSTYSILSTTIPLYNTLIDHVENTVDSENTNQIIKEAVKKCQEKLLVYYNKTGKTYLAATVLDP